MTGQISSLQNGISIISNNSPDEKLLTGEGLKTFLNEINNLLKNAYGKDSSAKGKEKIDKDVKEVISQILDSLKSGTPVIINIAGQTETLKLELNQTNVQNEENIPEIVNYNNDLNSKFPGEKKLLYSQTNELNNKEAVSGKTVEPLVQILSLQKKAILMFRK